MENNKKTEEGIVHNELYSTTNRPYGVQSRYNDCVEHGEEVSKKPYQENLFDKLNKKITGYIPQKIKNLYQKIEKFFSQIFPQKPENDESRSWTRYNKTREP